MRKRKIDKERKSEKNTSKRSAAHSYIKTKNDVTRWNYLISFVTRPAFFLNSAHFTSNMGRAYSNGLCSLLVLCSLLDFTTAATSPDGRLIKESYDYIIIGGGTSGLVVANRLSEDPNSKCQQRNKERYHMH